MSTQIEIAALGGGTVGSPYFDDLNDTMSDEDIEVSENSVHS